MNIKNQHCLLHCLLQMAKMPKKDLVALCLER